MSHYNHRDLFWNLRAVKLESFAHTWAKYFTFMKRISLYPVPVDGFDYSVKYVMFFELSKISKTNGFDEHDESFIELLEGPDALRCLNTKPSHFKEVYKDTPLDNFFDEWRFVTKLPEGIVEKHSWILFSHTDKGVESVIDLLKSKGASFKRDDLPIFENEVLVQSSPQNVLPANLKQNDASKSSHETFIKNLRIYYENDNEIKIQVPKKKAKNVTCDSLGFRDNQTLGWKSFIEILQAPDHIYELGPAFAKKEYGQKTKRLKAISFKLVTYFNEVYSAGLPENYKVFEPAKDVGTGKYRPKFNCATNPDREKSPLENEYEKFPKDELIQEIKYLAKEYLDSKDNAFMEKITVATEVALRKKWLTESEMTELIQQKTDKEVFQEESSKYDECINKEDQIKGH